ncbi:MAG: type II toxin-antitoxin system RelE/ParE family toxin [Deltaproteobacteria bacterium]|nr:type II toxin-antitoxin system RelE/ParE family toxin [Deltaproteobacteria bacterium]
MSSRRVDIHPEAVAEARAAAQWYRERSAPAANAFLAEVDRSVEKIAEDPEIWPRYVAGTRRFLLQRFPFSVVYRQVSGKIEIVAIAHGRRRPGYWKDRLA